MRPPAEPSTQPSAASVAAGVSLRELLVGEGPPIDSTSQAAPPAPASSSSVQPAATASTLMPASSNGSQPMDMPLITNSGGSEPVRVEHVADDEPMDVVRAGQDGVTGITRAEPYEGTPNERAAPASEPNLLALQMLISCIIRECLRFETEQTRECDALLTQSVFVPNEMEVDPEASSLGLGQSASHSLARISSITGPAPGQASSSPSGLVSGGRERAPGQQTESLARQRQEQLEARIEQDLKQVLPRLSRLVRLDELWEVLGECLSALGGTQDPHAVLLLQPSVEAFFLVHGEERDPNARSRERAERNAAQSREDQLAHIREQGHASAAGGVTVEPIVAGAGPSTSASTITSTSTTGSTGARTLTLTPDQTKFIKFAERHRAVLNQILRQSQAPLSEGPFAVLTNYTHVLDFDVKRRYFRHELQRMYERSMNRRDDVGLRVRRGQVFEDSFRELHRRSADEWKQRFYIVFEGEEGQDAGGLLREWYLVLSREIFNPNYVLFRVCPGNIHAVNPFSSTNPNHLDYFKFIGRFIAKAILDNKLLECYFTRSFYKHILGLPIQYTDIESEDNELYKGLKYTLENSLTILGYELSFTAEFKEFGATEVRELLPGGGSIVVTEANKDEYVRLLCQMKMTRSIEKQLTAFLQGFYELIPKKLISIFSEQELELLISGLPQVDIEDLRANTDYHKYTPNSVQVLWFWRAMRSFDQAERARFLQFVTGTSKVPLQGFAYLEGMNGIQHFQIHRDDRSTDRLPAAHTCFNQLDLPAYESYEKLRTMLLKAITMCSEGFGFA